MPRARYCEAMPTLRPLKPALQAASPPALAPQASGSPQPLTDQPVQSAEQPPPSTQAAQAAQPASRPQPADPQKYRVHVGPSAIDGQGAFADEPIPARRKIGEIRGEFVDMATARARAREAERSTGRIFMIAISGKRAVDATHSSDPLRFANHACVPNMVLKVQQGRVAFYALRDIAVAKSSPPAMGKPIMAGA